MKNIFETPELELHRFYMEDIMYISGLIDGGEGDNEDSGAFGELFSPPIGG